MRFTSYGTLSGVKKNLLLTLPIYNSLRHAVIFHILHFLINWMSQLRCPGFLAKKKKQSA